MFGQFLTRSYGVAYRIWSRGGGSTALGMLLVSQGAPIRLVAERVVFLWAVCDPTDLADRAMPLPSLVYHAFVR